MVDGKLFCSGKGIVWSYFFKLVGIAIAIVIISWFLMIGVKYAKEAIGNLF